MSVCDRIRFDLFFFYSLPVQVDGAAKIVDYMIEVIQTSSDKAAVGTALRSVRLIGTKHRSLLKKYRRPIEKFRSTTKDRDQRSDCTLIINMLDEERSVSTYFHSFSFFVHFLMRFHRPKVTYYRQKFQKVAVSFLEGSTTSFRLPKVYLKLSEEASWLL